MFQRNIGGHRLLLCGIEPAEVVTTVGLVPHLDHCGGMGRVARREVPDRLKDSFFALLLWSGLPGLIP
jgi:hypothetical protein